MRARIQRWGNSLALRLPKAAAEEMGVSEGSSVEITAGVAKLVVRPTHHYDLDDLLSQVRSKRRHAEVSTGARRGKEEW